MIFSLHKSFTQIFFSPLDRACFATAGFFRPEAGLQPSGPLMIHTLSWDPPWPPRHAPPPAPQGHRSAPSARPAPRWLPAVGPHWCPESTMEFPHLGLGKHSFFLCLFFFSLSLTSFSFYLYHQLCKIQC